MLDKRCNKCGIAKELKDFTVVSENKDGHDKICRQCRRANYKNMVDTMTNIQILNAENSGHKICKLCKLDKPLNEYPLDKSHKDGHKTACIPCNIIRDKKYYQNSLASKAKYRNTHRDKVNQYHREQLVNVKTLVMTHYGNGKLACVRCGFDDIRALTIDHINGDGNKHRKEMHYGSGKGLHMYKWLINNNYPQGFRTLCGNCQIIVEDEKRKSKITT